jgi:tRNA(Ile)-lysidine synthase
MALDPAVAAVRLAVRRGLLDVGDQPVLVACSGGADSLALVAAATFEARSRPWQVVGVTVDHGLQAGSAEHTRRVLEQMAGLGVDETVSVRVEVSSRGQGP